MILRLENTRTTELAPISFIPRSIAERAAALGGSARVEYTAHHTAVVVEIPL
jgi:signal transduction histidine kinase